MTRQELGMAHAAEQRMVADVYRRGYTSARNNVLIMPHARLCDADVSGGEEDSDTQEPTVPRQKEATGDTSLSPSHPQHAVEKTGPTTVAGHVARIFASLENVQPPFLYYNTTCQQRALLRMATMPPQTPLFLSGAYAFPEKTLLMGVLVAFAAGVIAAPHIVEQRRVSQSFRGMSTACKQTVDRMLRYA